MVQVIKSGILGKSTKNVFGKVIKDIGKGVVIKDSGSGVVIMINGLDGVIKIIGLVMTRQAGEETLVMKKHQGFGKMGER